MLTDKQMKILKEQVFFCNNPVYFFDNDADGLASFLLLHDIIKEGKGYSARTGPELSGDFSRLVSQENDKIFVLDKAMISEAFLYNIKKTIVWIDHHMPQIINMKNIIYINPRQNDYDIYYSTTSCIYDTFKPEIKRKWVAAVGMLGDWCVPDFQDELIKEYPNYISKGVTTPEVTKGDVRLMIRIFSMIQKGDSSSIRRAIDSLILVKNPYEILEQSSKPGKEVWRKYIQVNEEFKKVIETAETKIYDNVVVCIFHPIRNSFTKEIAQDLVLEHPDKIVLVLREKDGVLMGSIRGKNSLAIGEKAIKGLKASIGGHEDAAGLNISSEDLKIFIERLKNG